MYILRHQQISLSCIFIYINFFFFSGHNAWLYFIAIHLLCCVMMSNILVKWMKKKRNSRQTHQNAEEMTKWPRFIAFNQIFITQYLTLSGNFPLVDGWWWWECFQRYLMLWIHCNDGPLQQEHFAHTNRISLRFYMIRWYTFGFGTHSSPLNNWDVSLQRWLW